MTETTLSLSALFEKVEQLIAELDNRKKERDTTCSHLALEAFQLANDSGDKKLIIKAATALSHYYTDITSEFDKAIHYIKETIELLNDDDEAESKAEFYRRLGLNFDYVGELIQSKQAYDQSVELLEYKKDLSDTGVLTLARSLFNESIIYGET